MNSCLVHLSSASWKTIWDTSSWRPRQEESGVALRSLLSPHPCGLCPGHVPTKTEEPPAVCHTLGNHWPSPCHQHSHVPWGNKFIVAVKEQRNLPSKFFYFLLIDAEPSLLLYLIKTSLCQSLLCNFKTEQYNPSLLKLKEWQCREAPGKEAHFCTDMSTLSTGAGNLHR